MHAHATPCTMPRNAARCRRSYFVTVRPCEPRNSFRRIVVVVTLSLRIPETLSVLYGESPSELCDCERY